MKYLLVIGTKDAGKSTTIYEVCKTLNPSKVWKLDIGQKQLRPAALDNIFNDTFLIEVNGKMILAVAGAPTEQGVKITIIIKILIELNIHISFALVAMRSQERKAGFDTEKELQLFGDCVLAERIYQVPGDDFASNKEWLARISKYAQIVLQNIATK